MQDLHAAAVGCQACSLRQTCTGVVFGAGSNQSRLVMVGEAPGQQEDLLGEPFVGAAGKLLDQILTAASIQREDIYITNTVKCRPPGNRVPTVLERNICFPWLVRQVELIQPSIIVCLGAIAAQTILGPEIRITRDRGKVFRRKGKMIIPTYHPAALLRDEEKKKPVWEDFQKIRDFYLQDEKM